MEKKLSTIALLLCMMTSTAFAQSRISGTVISQEDGQPMVGVTVVLQDNKSTGAVTDIDGKFTINVQEGKKLTFSYVGMETLTLPAKANMRVSMRPNTVLSEVVVTGMLKVDKRIFTGATSKIDASQTKIDGMADISRSLEGRSAGVSVQNVSGTFGAAPKIRVRGATSIYGSSKPLWVVDGVIMEDVSNIGADDLASGDPETLISSAIAGLNADDIESFQILKDGSATSIYGARAMAGVIVVTTKKGRQGQANINYTGEFTTRMIPSYSNFDILNSQEQMDIYREMERKGWLKFSDVLNGRDYGVYGKMYELINTYNPATGQFVVPNTIEGRNAYLQQAEFRNTNWFKELFSAAIMQNHSVSMSGGTAKSNYYASLSAMIDPGWYKQSKVNRYTINLNTTHQLLENLSINLIGGAAYRLQKAPGTLGQDVDVVNGQVKRDFDINPYSYSLNTSRTLEPHTYYVSNYAPFNVLNELDNNYMDLNVLDAKFQFELKYKPVKGLELGVLGAFKYAMTSQEHKITEYSNQAQAYRSMANSIIRDANRYLYKDPDQPYALPMTVLPNGGFYRKTENRMSDYDFRATANYNRTFNNIHILNLFGGMETTGIERTRSYFNGVGMQYSVGEMPFYLYEYFKQTVEEGTDYYKLTNTNSRSAAFYGNATYSYQGKYVLNGTYRYEGSNQMGRSRAARWMSTWNISGAWNVHEESFFTKLKPLSHLTMRLSYSLTGTPPDPRYSNSTAIFRARNPYRFFAMDKEPGIALEDLANVDLTYEKKNELNFGLDFGLLKDRLNIIFDVYTRNNFDEMGNVPTQGVGGVIIRTGNVAEMKSNGMELSISSTNIKAKDFSWSTNFVYSYTNTEITKLMNRGRVIDLIKGNGYALQGYPARALFSIPFVKISNEGIPMLLNENEEVTSREINFQERNKTSYLKYEGPTDPKYTGSLGNMFNYKGFHLNLFMTYSFGNVVRLDPVFKAQYSDLTSMTKVFKNRFVQSGEEHSTNVPGILDYRSYSQDRDLRRAYNAYNYSDVRIAKGDFVRMKEISLAYDFPAKWFSHTSVNRMSLKLQATNLFLIYADKKLNGQDPEFFNSGGVAAPLPKQFTLTLKVGL